MSSKIGSFSVLHVPATTKKFLEQITSKKLREIFQIDDSVLCDEIKRYEGDFKEMFAETKKTLDVYKKLEQENQIITQAGQKLDLFRDAFVWVPTLLVGGLSLLYGPRYYLKNPIAGVGCVFSLVAVYAIRFFLIPKASLNLKELPDLNLQARKIKNHIQLKLKFLATDLEALETQSRTIDMVDIDIGPCKIIQAKRDQLMTAQAYFETVMTHRYFG
jgi:hypothetical protein